MLSEKYVMGIDFSKQPDNELWYITTDGQKLEGVDFIGNWNKQQGLEVVSHSYENGIGKVRYNTNVVKYGEGVLRYVRNCLLVSVPRSVRLINAFCFGEDNYQIDYLVFLRADRINYSTSHKPKIKKATFVMPGCTKFYEGNLTNVIEKKLRDIEYI